MAHLSLSLLGPFQATLDGEPIAGLGAAKVRTLLAYLAVEAHRHPRERPHPHTRIAVAELFWPERFGRVALANLRNALASLRKAIGDRESEPPLLLVTHQSIQLNPEGDCWVDVAAFAEAIAASKAHAHRSLEACSTCAERLRKVVDLYQGEFLAGLSVDSAPFEEWLVVEREALHRQVLDALHTLAAYHERRGEYAQAIGYARRQVALEPWRESAHRQWMRALSLSGDRDAALAQYEACRRVIENELGIEPEESTTALYHRILSATPASPVEAPMGSPSQDRLAYAAHNLPTPLTPLVGRAGCLDEIVTYLQDPTCRLLSLVGPGGIGKTRLALEAAWKQVGEYDGGVYLVPLAPAQSTDGVVSAVAQALGFAFYEVEGAETDPWHQLLNYLRRQNVLLVLDDLEHLIAGPAAGGQAEGDYRDIVALIADILRYAPNVKILTTSRVRLNAHSEQLVPISGMDYPPQAPGTGTDGRGEGQGLEAYSAVRLFLQSARRVRQDLDRTDELAQVGRICRLVGGMPLAILLAAAWVEVLSPAEIADQIERGLDVLETDERDVPVRHHSMRAVFDASWELLTEAERAAFAWLSVFRGGFTLQAATAVSGAEPRTLRGLAHKSFLQRSRDGRYDIHELLRQYGEGKLEEASSAAEARDGHSAYYAAALEGWEADLKCARQQAALDEMDLESENIRAAWEWAAERRHVALLDRGAMGLWVYHYYRLWKRQGAALFGKAAETLSADRSSPTPERLRVLAKILAAQSAFSELAHVNELQRQAKCLLERPELAAQDTRREWAFLQLMTGTPSPLLDVRESSSACERSLALYRALGDRWGAASALCFWGSATRRTGDLSAAERHLDASLAIFRALGDRFGMTCSLGSMAYVAIHRGQLETAERLIQEGLSIHREMGSQARVAQALRGLGDVAVRGGRFLQAQTLLQRSLALWEDLGNVYDEAHTKVYLVYALRHEGQYGRARSLIEEVLFYVRQWATPAQVAYVLRELGLILLAEGAYVEVERVLGECLDIFQGFATPAPERGIIARAALACAARGLGDISRAEQLLAEALRACPDAPTLWPLLHAVTAGALFLLDRGKIEQAVEIYALSACYPHVAHSRWFEDLVGAHVAAAAEHLSPEVVAAARERGRARELRVTVRELATEWGATER